MVGSSGEQSDGYSYLWYRSRPGVAITIAIVLFAAVSAARYVSNGSGQAVDILYSLPIALLAVAFGLRGGLIGAATGFALFAVLELTNGVGDIDVTGWVARAAGLFLLGFLLGHATDQIEAGQRRALADQERRRALRETARRQAEALEVSDTILQHLAAAKWMVETGRNQEAIDLLCETLHAGQQMVADQLPVRQGGIDDSLLDECPTRVERGGPPRSAIRTGFLARGADHAVDRTASAS